MSITPMSAAKIPAIYFGTRSFRVDGMGTRRRSGHDAVDP